MDSNPNQNNSRLVNFAISFRGPPIKISISALSTFGDIAREIMRIESLDRFRQSITLFHARSGGIALDHSQRIATSNLVPNEDGIIVLNAIMNSTSGEMNLSSMAQRYDAQQAQIEELTDVVATAVEMIGKVNVMLATQPVQHYRLLYPGDELIVIPTEKNALTALGYCRSAIKKRVEHENRTIAPGHKVLTDISVLQSFLKLRIEERHGKGQSAEFDESLVSTTSVGGMMPLDDAWISKLGRKSKPSGEEPTYVATATGRPFVRTLRVMRSRHEIESLAAEMSSGEKGSGDENQQSSPLVSATDPNAVCDYNVNDDRLYKSVDFWCVRVSLLDVEDAILSHDNSEDAPKIGDGEISGAANIPSMISAPQFKHKHYMAIAGHVAKKLSGSGSSAKWTAHVQNWLEPVVIPSANMMMHHVQSITLPIPGLLS